MKIRSPFLAVCTFLSFAAAAAVPIYRIEEILDLVNDQFFHTPWGINDLGTFVGVAEENLGPQTHLTAYLWKPSTRKLTLLPPLDASSEQSRQSLANDVNNKSQIVGSSGGRAVVWEKGVPRPLAAFPVQNRSEATAINELGQSVGVVYKPNDSGVVGPTAVTWTASGVMELGLPTGELYRSTANSINDRGAIAGDLDSDDTILAFVWNPTTGRYSLLPRLPEDYPFHRALKINKAGRIVGQSGKFAVAWNKDTRAVRKLPVPGESTREQLVSMTEKRSLSLGVQASLCSRKARHIVCRTC